MECSLWGTETTIIKVVQNQSLIKWSWTPTPIWTLLGSWACLQYFKYSIASVRLWWAMTRSLFKIPHFSASVACCTVPPLQIYKSQSSLSYYAGCKLSFRTVKHGTPVWNWSSKGLSRVGERSLFGRSWLSTWLEAQPKCCRDPNRCNINHNKDNITQYLLLRQLWTRKTRSGFETK